MPTRIQVRRGKAAFWESENPILRAGEPGFETDTKKFKFGDGVTPYLELPYSGADEDVIMTKTEFFAHVTSDTPHPIYDDGPDLSLLYENAKV